MRTAIPSESSPLDDGGLPAGPRARSPSRCRRWSKAVVPLSHRSPGTTWRNPRQCRPRRSGCRAGYRRHRRPLPVRPPGWGQFGTDHRSPAAPADGSDADRPARVRTASYTSVKDSSTRACTLHGGPAGVSGHGGHQPPPSPGMARCSNAVSAASGSTWAAADFTSAANSLASTAPFGANSQTCLPSGVATRQCPAS